MRIFSTLYFTVLALICSGQTAEELNNRSLDFLAKDDVKNALPLIKQAAEMGHPKAQYNYGYFYQQGIELEKNDSIANYWLLKSAEQGFIDAQFKIAYSFAVGRGIAKDEKQAFYWTRKCAEQNDPECISNLVGCFSNGVGTEMNSDSVYVWTVRAASLPDVENLQMSGIITNARISLAVKFKTGSYLPKDNEKAYMWYLIYNESKRDFSILDQLSNIEKIKELEKEISPSDKNNAKRDAENQINRPLKNLDKLYVQEF